MRARFGQLHCPRIGKTIGFMPPKRTTLARRLRVHDTSPEALLWTCLRDRRLDGLKFRRQVPIDGFVADFCCVEIGLTLELDGRQHSETPERDAARRQCIEAAGYLELRFTNDEVKQRLDWVIEEIRRAADIARARSPRPSLPRRN